MLLKSRRYRIARCEPSRGACRPRGDMMRCPSIERWARCASAGQAVASAAPPFAAYVGVAGVGTVVRLLEKGEARATSPSDRTDDDVRSAYQTYAGGSPTWSGRLQPTKRSECLRQSRDEHPFPLYGTNSREWSSGLSQTGSPVLWGGARPDRVLMVRRYVRQDPPLTHLAL